ncbi:FadR family transcriptional regulator [Jeotgalicoccus huakuii]|nr:FadR family transcriptional regulator [Jeotgalicoccus huakuii]
MDLIKKGKLSDIIFEDLEKRIKDKEYEVGEKLPSENELAKFYKVSRVPVREALSRLVSMGYVESSQGKGSYVKTTSVADQVKAYTYESFNKKELLDLLEMRTVLEVQSAHLSALRRTEEDLKEIAAALKHFKKITTNQHVIGMEADYDFHKAIVISTKNEYMIQTFNNLQTVHRNALEYSLKLNLGKPEKRESVYDEHELIYEAIKNQSPEKAAKYMETHLFNMRRKLGDDRI